MLAVAPAATTAAPSSRALPLASGLAIASIVWGALSFGAVYPWAYWTLALACAASGITGLAVARRTRAAVASRALAIGMAAVALSGFLQVVPLPLALHASLSPAAATLLPAFDFFYGARLVEYRALSLVPAATWTALALYGSLTVFLLGMSRLLALGEARRIAESLAVFGVLLALVGIIQQPLYSGEIYGVWAPQFSGRPFGPFVNRNHFAGWMLMALPIVLALLCAGLERAMVGLRPGWRYRVLWLSSPDANRLILLAVGAAVMALSLVLTMSRSGISALAVALLLTGWFVARGGGRQSRKAAGAVYLVLLAFTIVGWAGADRIVARFSNADWSEFNNRRGAWADAVNVVSDFRLTGAGLRTYDAIATHYQRHDPMHRFGEAHNDYLQLAAEGGLLVGLPVAVCVLIVVRDVKRRMKEDPGSTSWWLRRGAVTALVAIAVQETVDFSLQMPGNAALLAVVCAIALHKPPSRLGAQPVTGRAAPRPTPREASPPANLTVFPGPGATRRRNGLSHRA